jgi:hypothetical protein
MRRSLFGHEFDAWTTVLTRSDVRVASKFLSRNARTKDGRPSGSTKFDSGGPIGSHTVSDSTVARRRAKSSLTLWWEKI